MNPPAILALHVFLSNEPAITGLQEPAAHRYYREHPWEVSRVGTEKRAKVSGFTNRRLTESDSADAEANAVRLAESMVREAFRRFREQMK